MRQACKRKPVGGSGRSKNGCGCGSRTSVQCPSDVASGDGTGGAPHGGVLGRREVAEGEITCTGEATGALGGACFLDHAVASS